jgi:2-C-methyl-D-erythritol 4-phosphate cytidylyltransferase
LGILKKALETASKQGLTVTDEASAIELAGWQPMMVEGHQDNIKITVPQDMALASLYMQQQAEQS